MAPPADQGRAGAHCPRCGYDLRGIIGAWSEACPLGGRCGECGLDFAWRDLFGEWAYRPRWCIEFSSRRWLVPSAACTAAMALLPRRFWTSVRMTFALERTRLALYVLLLAAGCYACFALSHAALAERHLSIARSAGAFPADHWVVVLRTVFLPFSDQAIALGRSYWMSPRDMLEAWHEAVSALLMSIVIVASCPLVLAGLVVTRRQAGVRGAHLVRIAACSAPWVVAVWLGTVVETLTEAFRLWRLFQVVEWLMLVGMPLWLLLWWRAAIRHYLHLRHAWATAFAVTLIGLLSGLVSALVIERQLAEYLFWRLGLVS